MGEREGSRFQNVFDGRWLYNCHCNGGVFNLGHRNPTVVGAVRGALEHLDIGNHHLVSGWRARLAEQLAETTGAACCRAWCSASAVAKPTTSPSRSPAPTPAALGVVSAVGGYHGHTGLSMAAGDPEYRDPFGPNLPGFVQVPFNDLGAIDGAIDDTTAAVILEPIPATLGMPIPEPGYLAGVAAPLPRPWRVPRSLDEVQTGLGRTGTAWCFQQEGIEPDIMTTGKGLSGGIYPDHRHA